MKKTVTYGFLLLSTSMLACSTETPDTTNAQLDYPETKMVEQVDNYHGTEVADPYRWLEDDVRESEAVKNWVDAQNEVTFAYLATIPERESIRQRMTELWDYERYGMPSKAG